MLGLVSGEEVVEVRHVLGKAKALSDVRREAAGAGPGAGAVDQALGERDADLVECRLGHAPDPTAGRTQPGERWVRGTDRVLSPPGSPEPTAVPAVAAARGADASQDRAQQLLEAGERQLGLGLHGAGAQHPQAVHLASVAAVTAASSADPMPPAPRTTRQPPTRRYGVCTPVKISVSPIPVRANAELRPSVHTG